jgi:hypothetical protein
MNSKGGWDVRYVTHQFAHAETLDRAQRWLIHAGIAPDRMQARHNGVPMLAVAAEPGEVDGIEMVIDAAELADPDGMPSIWHVARIEPTNMAVVEGTSSRPVQGGEPSFVLTWHPVDVIADEAARSEIEEVKAFLERWE